MARWLLSALLVFMGIAHFVAVDRFAVTIPDWLPAHRLLVWISGVAEIAGGIGLQIPALRRAAAWGVMLLFVAVFPANINMAVHAERFTALAPAWALWARLPLQALLLWWAWRYTRPAPAHATR